jgi:hypothetical protein
MLSPNVRRLSPATNGKDYTPVLCLLLVQAQRNYLGRLSLVGENSCGGEKSSLRSSGKVTRANLRQVTI